MQTQLIKQVNNVGKISDGIAQATESTQGVISAEGKIGKNKAKGSIDGEGIWDLGIDFKVGGLGITNDYGGAITISIAGQSITWGREGGKIHYDLGGFEVIVEARDCVVTETKLIMGIEVASHTYLDPGCKLPDPEEEPDPNPPPSPEEGIDPDSITDDSVGYVLVGQSFFASDTHYKYPTLPLDFPGNEQSETQIRAISVVRCSLSNGQIIEAPGFYSRFPPGTSMQVKASSSGAIWKNYELFPISGHLFAISTSPQPYSFSGHPNGDFYYTYFVSNEKIISSHANHVFAAVGGYATGFVAFGPMATIAKWIKNVMNPGWSKTKHIIYQTIPLGVQKLPKPKPFLRPGVPPHVKNDCCEEILDSLDDLKEVLHVDFFKKEKFPVPSYLLAPGVDASKTTVANNYYNLFQKLFQALAHGAIISPKVDIQDADAVKEGDQTVNSEYLSATGWAEAITKMLYEIVDDGNIATNMDIRTGVTVTQLLVAVADLSHKVDCIIDCIGVTTIRRKGEVETSFSLVVEGENTKGFDPKKANEKLDLNSDISTEQLLPSLLRARKNPIVKEEIHPKSSTLFELLQDLKNKE